MASQLTVYLLDPTHVVAMSLDGDVTHAGPWQASPIFLKDPAGNDFVNGQVYYIHEQDLLTPDRYIPTLVRRYSDPLVTNGGSGKDGTMFFTATVDPSTIGGSLGKDGDFCINKTSGDVFQRFGNLPNATAGTWVLSFNIKGPRGPAGPTNTGGGGSSGSALVYMVPDSDGLEDFPPPGAGHEYDIAGWQVIYDLAQAAFHADDFMQGEIDTLQNALTGKVDKVVGQRLTEQNFSLPEKQKLATLQNYVLPVAAANALGGVKAGGSGYSIAQDGTLSIAPTSSGVPAPLSTVIVNSGYTTYCPVLTMPASSGGTYDESVLLFNLSNWGSTDKKTYQLSCSAREGFRVGSLVCYGNDSIGSSLRAYPNNDGSTTLYIVSPPGFHEISFLPLIVHQAVAATMLVFSIANQEPAGTPVYDSLVTKPNLVVSNEGIITRSLPAITAPANMLTRDVVTGKLGAVSLDNALLAFVNGASDSTIQALCARLQAINCGGATVPVVSVPAVFTPGSHFTSVPLTATTPVLAHDYVVFVQENTCDIITGYIVDRNYPNVPAPVDIFINNTLVATITATNARADLATQYGGNPGSLYGFEYRLPASYKNGSSHLTRVFVANGATEATYAGSTTSPVCAAAPATPYVVQYIVRGPAGVADNETKRFWVGARYSDSSEVRYAGTIAWRLGALAANTSIELEGDGSEIDVVLHDTPATQQVLLIATINSVDILLQIELVDTTCHRPTSGLLSVYLAYNYITSDGNAHLFSTLDDANNTMGRVFNEANIGITGFTKFKAQLANYNVGTEVFLNWAADGYTSCAHASNAILYALDASAGDSQKQAIYVVNGRIADAKASSYAPPAAPVATTVSRISYRQAGNGTNDGEFDVVLSKAAEIVQVRLRTSYTNGQVGAWSDWFDINQGRGVSGYITTGYSPDYSTQVGVRPKTNPAASRQVSIPSAPGVIADTQLYPA